MSKDGIQLKVLDAYAKDVRHGFVRIDHDSSSALAASAGDIIEIKGAQITAAKCLRPYPSVEGKGTIRIDGLIRHNAGIEIGDTIAVRKMRAPQAERVTVLPMESIPPIDGSYIKDALEGVPLIKGDFVTVPYFGGRLAFQVTDIMPADDAVLMAKETRVTIAERDVMPRDAP